MSRSRQLKHKKLVWFEMWSKKIGKYTDFNKNGNRWRQVQNQKDRLFLKEIRDYRMFLGGDK